MAFDAFLKIDGIDGESTDDKHKGEIDVLSFSWGASQPGVAAGAVARRAKASISDISIVKRLDKATPKLLSQTCAGGAFPTATLTVRKVIGAEGGTEDFLKVTMSDVMISGISAAGNPQTEPAPLEQLSLNFSKIEIAYMSDTGQSFVGACSSAFIKGE